MGYATRLYKAFLDLGEEKASALAEFAEYIESRRAATSEELKALELKLTKEIESIRLEIEKVRTEIHKVKGDLVKWMFLFWTGQIVALIGIIKWLL